MTRCATVAVEREEHLAAARVAGVTCVFQNSGEEGSDPMRPIKRLARFTHAPHLLRDHVAQAVSRATAVSSLHCCGIGHRKLPDG